MNREQRKPRRRDDSEPPPRGFVPCTHYEALSLIRRTSPERYISMSATAKAALELYERLRGHRAQRAAA